ncbi:MAG: hypothetical protein AAF990_15010 [Bacteroidota bacterium]
MTRTIYAPSRKSMHLSMYVFCMFFVTLLVSSCTPKIFQDAQSLSNFSNLKNQATSLLSKATGNYSDHASDVEALTKSMNDQISYEKSRGEKNNKTVQMLQLLMDPASNLLGGVLNRWKSEGKLGQGFVNEATKLVGNNFDKIINLEKAKPAQ